MMRESQGNPCYKVKLMMMMMMMNVMNINSFSNFIYENQKNNPIMTKIGEIFSTLAFSKENKSICGKYFIL